MSFPSNFSKNYFLLNTEESDEDESLSSNSSLLAFLEKEQLLTPNLHKDNGEKIGEKNNGEKINKPIKPLRGILKKTHSYVKSEKKSINFTDLFGDMKENLEHFSSSEIERTLLSPKEFDMIRPISLNKDERIFKFFKGNANLFFKLSHWIVNAKRDDFFITEKDIHCEFEKMDRPENAVSNIHILNLVVSHHFYWIGAADQRFTLLMCLIANKCGLFTGVPCIGCKIEKLSELVCENDFSLMRWLFKKCSQPNELQMKKD